MRPVRAVHRAGQTLRRILDRADPPTAPAVAAETAAILRLGPAERDRLRWALAARMDSQEFAGCHVLLGGRVSPSLPPSSVGGLLWLVRDHARRAGWRPPEPIPRVVAVGAAALAGLHMRPGDRAEALRLLSGLSALPLSELEHVASPPGGGTPRLPATRPAPPPVQERAAHDPASSPIGWTPQGPTS